MSNAHHPSEAEIFAEALRFPTPDERAGYVKEAAGGDEQLRQRVEALLRAHDNAGGFLDNPPVAVAASTIAVTTGMVPLTEKPGDRIGHYKLLEQIGVGGCGVVYVADQQEPVRRRVALKIIKLGMDTKQVVARFEAERQALALMDHPNIAKILDAGATDTGRPYFVMELVRGIWITDYCDKNSLSIEDRLKLFIQVCAAIQHAHQKGIIHRDIKPSNILVTLHDGVPVPKVIDFGIAKATSDQRLADKTVYTALEQFIGTPAYMSPEQAEMSGLDIDTRSDIYSLGVLLYELLTGRTPFDAATLLRVGLDQMRRIIREQEPQRPSTRLGALEGADLTVTANHRRAEPPKLVNLIRGDLDWIVMKALEKDRTRRFETANGLAVDLQRHLSSEPVEARPYSNVYRFGKLVRRNKFAFAATTAVFASLIIGLGLSTWLFLRERKAVLRAVAAEQTEKRLRREADNAGQIAVAQKIQVEESLFAARIERIRAERIAGRDEEAYAVLQDAKSQKTSSNLKAEAAQLTLGSGLRLMYSIPFGWVYAGEISTDGNFLAIGGVPEDFDVHGNRVFGWGSLYTPTNAPSSLLTWEVNSGKLLGRTSWDSRYRFSFAPNNRIAVPKTNNVVELWDPVSGDTVATFPFGGSIIFSPDGRLLAITRRGMTKVFNLENPAHILASATGYMVSFPDAEMILMRDEQETLLRWNIRSNTTVPLFTPDTRVVCISALGNAALLDKKNSGIESNSIHTISFVDLVSGREQVLDSFSGANGSPSITAGLAPDGRHAFTGFAYTEKQWAKNINVFRISSKGIERAIVPTPTYLRQALVDSAATRTRASSGLPADLSALMPWDYIDSFDLDAFAKLNRLIDANGPKPKSGVSVVKKGTMFVPADREATTGVIALAARNGLLVTGGDGFVKSWDKIGGPHEATNTSYLIGGLVRVYRIKAPVLEKGTLGNVYDLAFSPVDDRLAVNYVTSKLVRNQHLFSLENVDIPGLNINTIRFLSNGTLQKVIIKPGYLQDISVENGGLQPSLIHLDGPMLSYDTSPNGRFLAVIQASKLNGILVPDEANISIDLYDLVSGYRTNLLTYVNPKQFFDWDFIGSQDRKVMPQQGVRLAFSPDSKFLFATVALQHTNCGYCVWTLSGRRESTFIPFDSKHGEFDAFRVCISSSGYICSSSEDGIQIRDLNNGEVVGHCELAPGIDPANWPAEQRWHVRSLAAHPKDRFFATGDQQGNISLYEFPSGLEITHWQAHESQISALAFNQNGMILVSGDEEGKFKIWDIGFLREEMTSLGLGW